MVEPPLDFFEIEMKVFLRDTTVMIKPVFSIGPEAFNTVDVCSTLGFSFVFLYHHMISSDIKECVGMPVIGIVKAAGLCVINHQRDKITVASAVDGKGPYIAVALVDPKDYALSSCSPASLSGDSSTEHGFIHLDLSIQRSQFFHLTVIDGFPENTEPSLEGLSIQGYLESQSINGNSQTKELHETAFPIRRYPGFVPQLFFKLSGQSTLATSLLPRRKLPEFSPLAARTFIHC